MKPLKRCVNGCQGPLHRLSKVLCEACFEKLRQQFKALRARLDANDEATARQQGDA